MGIGPAATTVRALVRGYQLFVSPWLGANCRYLPTCSEYAIEAVETHGAARGGWLALRRLLRCHPWGGSGLDPVPTATHDHTDCAHDSAAHRHRRADRP